MKLVFLTVWLAFFFGLETKVYGFAQNHWVVDEQLSFSPNLIKALKQKYPLIKSNQNLTLILQSLAQNQPLSELYAVFDPPSSVWKIMGTKARLVKDIEIHSRARLIRQPLYATLQNDIGLVDSEETKARVHQAAIKHLQRKGYREAGVRVVTEPDGDGVLYNIYVDEGDPCILKRIDIGFVVPRDISLDLEVGDVCDMEEIERSVEDFEASLKDLGYTQLKLRMDALKYDPDRDAATLTINGTLGQRIRYEIVDENKLFLIDDLFADEELTRVDPTIIGPDAMAAELARRYRQRGFLDAVVTGPTVKQEKQDLFVYLFKVNPGRQYFIKEVKFEGVSVFKEDELNDILGLKSFWQTSIPANLEDVQQGITALKGRYQQLGYWETKIRDPGMGQRDKETGSVRILIQVEEGRQVKLEKITVSGQKRVSQEEIIGVLDADPGEPLDRAQLLNWQQAVKSLYVSKGYLYADADLKLTTTSNRKTVFLTIEVKVNEGPLVYVGQVSVKGLAKTLEKVVRRELLFHEGDWYNPQVISKSRQNLSSLGIFRSVQIVPVDRGAFDQKQPVIDLVVEVQETKAGVVAFGPGWSLNKGWNYGAEASYSNIGGEGRLASIRGSFSEEKDQYAIGNKTLVGRKIGAGYTEPYLLDKPIDVRTKAHQKAEWSGELWGIRFGGEVEFVHKLREIVDPAQVSIFYSQEIARTEGRSIKEDQLLASNVRIGSVGLRLNYDHRDQPTFPLRGFLFDQEFAWARYELGGDLRYFRWDTNFANYFAITDQLVLALGIGVQSYDSVGRKGEALDVLPPSERLFSGGSETVRGYESRSLGPVVKSPVYVYNKLTGTCDVNTTYSTLFGSTRTTLKVELRRKITDDIAITAFSDNGNVFLSGEQLNQFSKAYEEPVAVPENVPDDAACRALGLTNQVQENFPYRLSDLLTNPRTIMNKHFFSYGAALSWLLPVGSLNLSYGLPWKQPRDALCSAEGSQCLVRHKRTGHWITRGEWYLNVGARF